MLPGSQDRGYKVEEVLDMRSVRRRLTVEVFIRFDGT